MMKKPYIPGLIIVLSVIIIYLPALDIYPRGDDFEWLASSYEGWKQPGQLLKLINHFFRPLVKLSYLLDYTFFKTNPLGYNLTTLLFHLVNVFLLYWLMFRLFRRIPTASLIAFCFGVSAMYSEVTLWSAGRPDSILLMFMLGVLIAMDGLIDQKEKKPYRDIAVIALTLLAIGSKETWILLPFLAMAYLWAGKGLAFKKALKSSLFLFVLLVLYIAIFMVLPSFTGSKSPTAYAGLDIGAAVEKFGFLMFKYTGAGDSFTGAIWQYGLIFLVMALLTYYLFRSKNRIALLGLSWMLITLAISLPIRFAPSRYNYLPLIGFWILIVAFLEAEFQRFSRKYDLKKPLKILVVVIPLLFYAGQQVIMLQWEIKDYRRWGSTHQEVARMYAEVKDQLPHDRPIVFIDQGTRKAVQEAADAVQGYRKLLFVRETAIWQQMYLSSLSSFFGDPFNETLEPVPPGQLDRVFQGEFAVLVFTDSGFFISEAHKDRIREYYRQNRALPYKTEALQWLKR
jgi:hypothetical protein